MRLVTKQLLSQLETIRLASRRRIGSAHGGERPSLRKGSSLEFSDYREYLQGDDVRSIDWNVYARTERLFLKLFLEEESRPVYFLIDCSQSMDFGNPSKLEYALALAVCLSYASLRKYDRPQILMMRDKTFRAFAFHSLQAFFPMVEQIEKQKAGGETFLTAALRKISLSRLARGHYFLFSDFYSPDGWDGVKLLAGAGNELHCVQILSPEEIDPSFRGDLQLIDSETSGRAEVSVTPRVLKQYRTRVRALQDAVRSIAHRSAAGYHPVNTATSLENLIFYELRKAGIVL